MKALQAIGGIVVAALIAFGMAIAVLAATDEEVRRIIRRRIHKLNQRK